MSAHPILSAVTVASAFSGQAAFSMDRVLACGPSTAWLEAGWSAAPIRRRAVGPRLAPITGFVEYS